MAIVPRANENVRMSVSSPVPIGSTGWTRRQGDAIANLGGEVQQVGEKLLRQDMEITKAEQKGKINNIAKEGQDFAERNSKPDGSDYTQRLNEYTQPKMDAVSNESWIPSVKRDSSAYAGMVKDELQTHGMIKSAGMLEQNNFTRIENLHNDSANRLRQTPNLAASELKVQNSLIDKQVQAGVFRPENAIKLKTAFYDKASKSIIAGMQDRQQYGAALNLLGATQKDVGMVSNINPDQAVSLGYINSAEAKQLKDTGKDFEIPILTKGDKFQVPNEMALIMSGMSPQERNHMISQNIAKLRENTEIRLADLNSQVSGFEKVAGSGQVIQTADVAKLKEQINGNPNLTKFAKTRLHDAVNTAYVKNQTLQIAAASPRGSRQEIISMYVSKLADATAGAAAKDPSMAGIETDFAAKGRRIEAMSSFINDLDKMYEKDKQDPASFSNGANPQLDTMHKASKDAGVTPQGNQALKQYNDTQVAAQLRRGLAPNDVRILTVDEAKGISQNLASIGNATDTGKYLDDLQQTYGDHFPRVLNEAAKVDPSLKDFAPIAYASPQTRDGLVDAIKNKANIEKEFSGKMADDTLKLTVPMINSAVKSRMGEFRLATMGSANDSSRLGVVQSMENLVSLQVKRDMSKDPNANVSDVVEKAYQDVVESNYSISTGGGSSVLVPKEIVSPEAVKIVSTFMDVYSKAENFADLNVHIPAADSAQARQARLAAIGAGSKSPMGDLLGINIKPSGDVKAKVPTDVSRSYYDDLARKTRWVTNDTQDGIKLMEQMQNGNLQPVFDNNKKAIERSYDDINKRPGEKVINSNRTLKERFANLWK